MATRSAKWLWIGLGFLCAVCGLSGVLMYKFLTNLLVGDLSELAAAVDRERAETRRQGIPVEPEDLQRTPAVPPDQNAAPLYREAFRKLPEIPSDVDQAIQRVLRNEALEADFTQVAAKFDGLEPWLQTVIRATRLPSCDFERDWSQGMYLELPELAEMKKCAKWLTIRGVIAARRGNVAKFEESIRAASQIGVHLSQEPILISSLVQIASDQVAQQGIAAALRANPSNAALLSASKKVLLSSFPRPDLKSILGGECVLTVAAIRRLTNLNELYPEASASESLSMSSAVTPEMKKAFETQYLRKLRECVQIVAKYDEDYLLQAEALQGLVRTKRTIPRIIDLVDMALFPAIEQVSHSIGRHQARYELTKAYVAILDFHRTKKRWPKDLAEVGEFVDPLAKRPLRYFPSDGGFTIYSVGADGRDDGGRERREAGPTGSPTAFDEVMKFP